MAFTMLEFPGFYLRFLLTALCAWLVSCHPSRSSVKATETIPSAGRAEPAAAVDLSTIIFAPLPVAKSTDKRIFAHLMPWFEIKEANGGAGTWGQHWTMKNENPDVIGPDGRRQIASYYYPLTGPYASGDSNLIDYQLLMMKFSGIDGVFIDWPGTLLFSDYRQNLENTEKIIARLDRVGLKFAIVYEDGNIGVALAGKSRAARIAAAQKDLLYLQNNYFRLPTYERSNGLPVLLDFGPETFRKESEWRTIFSVLQDPIAFITLWGHSGNWKSAAAGIFAWISPDNLASLAGCYQKTGAGILIASAYPGFDPFYSRGGWKGPGFVIPSGGTANLAATLDLALQSPATYIQLPTWNDYGEGTMIEPTVEFQYNLLTTLQNKLRVRLRLADLELVYQLYIARLRYQGNPEVQKRLDQVFYYLVSLQTAKAAQQLKQLLGK